jgi:hypothetical protein
LDLQSFLSGSVEKHWKTLHIDSSSILASILASHLGQAQRTFI